MTTGPCRICRDPRRRTIRMNLMRSITIAGRRSSRGCGATEICEPCWRELTDGFPRRGGSRPK